MANSNSNNPDFLEKGALQAAKKLIGWRLYTKEPDGALTGGIITETEAYTQSDAASHSYKGQTPRNAVMFGPPGHLYVYFTYGMHYCANIVTGPAGTGEAVLIRALLPDQGLATMRNRRHNRPDLELTNGPAKLCQALGIAKADNGQRLNASRFLLLPPQQKLKIHATTRIGITKDQHKNWRFLAIDI